ncbi:MAG: hypothetical protein RML56_13655 [Burkholderiales bacterium]|nr:hypothetical protein [Burkholderiales bacterium]
MAWTAGQREFVPLLVGLCPLLPAGAMTRRREIDWVILEEAEMGLHPNGIMALMLLVLDLMSRGYRVAMSTHSPLVLDVVWAIRHLERDSWKELLEIFGISGVTRANAAGEVRMAEAALRKRYRVFALIRGRYVVSRDISEVDPASSDRTMAGWGGLTPRIAARSAKWSRGTQQGDAGCDGRGEGRIPLGSTATNVRSRPRRPARGAPPRPAPASTGEGIPVGVQPRSRSAG